MSRQEIYAVLSTSPLVTAYVDPEGIMGNSSVDTPTERPFLVMSWGLITPGVGPSNVQLLDIDVHDEPGDYGRIDSALLACRTALDDYFATQGVTCVDWTGDGPDQQDEGYGTIFRTGSFRVIGSKR